MLTIIVTLKLNLCLIIKIDGNLKWHFQKSLRESEGDFQRQFDVSGTHLPPHTCSFTDCSCISLLQAIQEVLRSLPRRFKVDEKP